MSRRYLSILYYQDCTHQEEMGDDEIQAQPYHSLSLPVPAWAFVHPVQKGDKFMHMPTFALLVKKKRLGKSLMFDLGCRKDWWIHAPAAKKATTNGIPAMEVSKTVNEILREGGKDDQKFDAVVWSHQHSDHIGAIALFPESTDLYVGPGFKEKSMPGDPASQDSPVLETDFK